MEEKEWSESNRERRGLSCMSVLFSDQQTWICKPMHIKLDVFQSSVSEKEVRNLESSQVED